MEYSDNIKKILKEYPELHLELEFPLGITISLFERSHYTFKKSIGELIVPQFAHFFDKVLKYTLEQYFTKSKYQLEYPITRLQKIIRTVFNEKNYNSELDWNIAYDFRSSFATLFTMYFDEKKLSKVKLPLKTLMPFNRAVASIYTEILFFKIEKRLENILKKKKFDEMRLSLFYLIDNKSYTVNSFTKKNKRIIQPKDVERFHKIDMEFWNIISSKDSYKFSPNKKYTKKMYEFTSELRFQGKKDFVAYRETLEKFGLDPLKDDSYRKSYSKYLKQK